MVLDHLRSDLGIISGLGSFAALYRAIRNQFRILDLSFFLVHLQSNWLLQCILHLNPNKT